MRLMIPTLYVWLAAATCVHAEGRPFFVFDNAFRDFEGSQALLLKKLGYDGLCTRPSNASDALYAEFDQHGLDISATYVTLEGDETEIPEGVVRHIVSLEGRNTLVWLMLRNEEASDEAAVAVIRKVCDLAKANRLEVALYPHAWCCTDTVEKCDRLRKMADRSNLGISFNLCHFLYQNDEQQVEPTIKAAAPHLKLVQISGAFSTPPGGQKDMARLIQPLGEGNFDVGRVLRALDEAGYRGPINLQCYNIPQPAEQHLATSMRTWKELTTPTSEQHNHEEHLER